MRTQIKATPATTPATATEAYANLVSLYRAKRITAGTHGELAMDIESISYSGMSDAKKAMEYGAYAEYGQ